MFEVLQCYKTHFKKLQGSFESLSLYHHGPLSSSSGLRRLKGQDPIFLGYSTVVILEIKGEKQRERQRQGCLFFQKNTIIPQC